MVDEKMKKALIEANGFQKKVETQNIREGVRAVIPHVDDEIAIHRHAIAYLFDIISNLHSGELDNTEFASYNSLVESIKSQVKNDISGGVENDN